MPVQSPGCTSVCSPYSFMRVLLYSCKEESEEKHLCRCRWKITVTFGEDDGYKNSSVFSAAARADRTSAGCCARRAAARRTRSSTAGDMSQAQIWSAAMQTIATTLKHPVRCRWGKSRPHAMACSCALSVTGRQKLSLSGTGTATMIVLRLLPLLWRPSNQMLTMTNKRWVSIPQQPQQQEMDIVSLAEAQHRTAPLQRCVT